MAGETERWMREREREAIQARRRTSVRQWVLGPYVVSASTGLSGQFHALRTGRLVSLFGSLSGAPEDTLPVALYDLPEELHPEGMVKIVVGGSASSNTGERLLSLDNSGVLRIVSWSGGTGLWLNGFSYVAAL